MKHYLKNPEAISRYLYSVIQDYGFKVRWNLSDFSESRYLKICMGTREIPLAIHLRIANHPVSRYNDSTRFDYDICVSRARAGTITYIKFIDQFAREQGLELPRNLFRLLPGTADYKNYSIELQRNSAR